MDIYLLSDMVNIERGRGMGVRSTQNVSSICQEFTSISKQNPEVLSTSSETVPESLIQEARGATLGELSLRFG